MLHVKDFMLFHFGKILFFIDPLKAASNAGNALFLQTPKSNQVHFPLRISLKPNTENQMQVREQENQTGQAPEFAARVAAAFNGKDHRELTRQIKNNFPDMRTGELNMKIIMLKAGHITNENILKAIEAL
jgi:hypothetical protein